MTSMSKRLRIFTWHVHGNYLYNLSQCGHEFFLPVRDGRRHPYGGRGATFAFGANVHEIMADEVAGMDFDLILYQSAANYLTHQYELFSPRQRQLPRIFLEHDPPRENATDQLHVVSDPEINVVHVTHYNRLMWDNGSAPTTVVEHGVHVDPAVQYTGEFDRGLVVVNNLAQRGRRLGLDVFERFRRRVPLDLVGMGSEILGGRGEIPPHELAAFAARYRFMLHPARYTSLGLSVCEAMTIGMPVVGLATTELPSVITNGVNGLISNNLEELEAGMQRLLDDPAEAHRLGAAGQQVARQRFSIERFTATWDQVFRAAVAATTGSTTALRAGVK
jgi:glycosyltransferase involved in cell wall biosynthesis